MLHDDRNHLIDIDRVQLHVARKCFRGLLARHVGIILDLLDQAKEAFIGGVVGSTSMMKPSSMAWRMRVFVEGRRLRTGRARRTAPWS